MKTLNKSQEEKLIDAFKAICNMSFASTDHNHSLCGSFHTHPFNKHWDLKTANEVMQHVKTYVSTWVVWPLEEVTGIKKEQIEEERIKQYNKLYVKE